MSCARSKEEYAIDMKVTVFTPTYNRGYIIETLYRSLRRQTCKDFEWLVIDDGSSDDTEERLSVWMEEETEFPIRYYKQPNGGKCRAINRGLDLAQGELFFTMDSDDYLTDDAIAKVICWFEQLSPRGDIQGIDANRGFSVCQTENYLFDEESLDMSLLDIYSFCRGGRRVFDGERAFVFYTDFHRHYKYPEFPGENFMTEAIVWNRMAADGYKMRFYNDIIWVFEYKADGLTRAGSSVFLNNPRGYGLWLREKAEFEGISLLQKVKMWYTFSCDLYHRYDVGLIAECIRAPVWFVRLIAAYCRMKEKPFA